MRDKQPKTIAQVYSTELGLVVGKWSNEMGVLSERVRSYVSGPAWEPIRGSFMSICEEFLGVDAESRGELTTIYVKFSITTQIGEQVYAVVWLRSSKQLVIGMSLPDEIESPMLGAAPKRCSYKGLTKYFTICPGDALPNELEGWAKQAYEQAVSRK